MIHFDFIVDDIDAENIIDCIHVEMLKIRELAVFEPSATAAADMYKQANYLERLKDKMHNKKVQ